VFFDLESGEWAAQRSRPSFFAPQARVLQQQGNRASPGRSSTPPLLGPVRLEKMRDEIRQTAARFRLRNAPVTICGSRTGRCHVFAGTRRAPIARDLIAGHSEPRRITSPRPGLVRDAARGLRYRDPSGRTGDQDEGPVRPITGLYVPRTPYGLVGLDPTPLGSP